MVREAEKSPLFGAVSAARSWLRLAGLHLPLLRGVLLRQLLGLLRVFLLHLLGAGVGGLLLGQLLVLGVLFPLQVLPFLGLAGDELVLLLPILLVSLGVAGVNRGGVGDGREFAGVNGGAGFGGFGFRLRPGGFRRRSGCPWMLLGSSRSRGFSGNRWLAAVD